MASRTHLLIVVLSLAVALPLTLANGSEPQSKDTSQKGGGMIMEHINMECSNCHGKDGPKGMMMEHQGVACTVCHDGAGDAGGKMISVKNQGGTLKQKMMMEHRGVNCTSCHSEGGPNGMMMEHENIGCSVCHPAAHD